MLAAALTVWLMFSLWLIAPYAGLSHRFARTALVLLCAELLTLFLWSYATERCDGRDCAPLAQAAGIAARTDLPLLAAAFVAIVVLRLLRRGHPPASTTS